MRAAIKFSANRLWRSTSKIIAVMQFSTSSIQFEMLTKLHFSACKINFIWHTIRRRNFLWHLCNFETKNTKSGSLKSNCCILATISVLKDSATGDHSGSAHIEMFQQLVSIYELNIFHVWMVNPNSFFNFQRSRFIRYAFMAIFP